MRAATIQGAIWSAGAFEEIAAGAAPAHDALVAALAPQPGERWLDVATGTGAVALRAARAGADVTAVDVAPRMLAAARRIAGDAGVSIRFDVGDAERLPYSDGAFDVVSSAQGVSFALDAAAAAFELARVCRPGGRLGLTCLVPAGFAEALALAVGMSGPALAWGEPGYVRGLLGAGFELEFTFGDAPLVAASAEAAADLYVRCYPPIRFFVDTRARGKSADEMREVLLELLRPYETADGLRAPRRYLLVTGRRRYCP